jgi:hypothetical protein
MTSLRLLLWHELISLIFLLILLDLNLLLVVLAHDRHGISVTRETLLLWPNLILCCVLLAVVVAAVVFNLILWCSWLMFVISITPFLWMPLSVRFSFLWLYMLWLLLLRASVLHHLHLSLDLPEHLIHASRNVIDSFYAIHRCNRFTHRAISSYVVKISLWEVPRILSCIWLYSNLLFAILHVIIILKWFTDFSVILRLPIMASLLLLSVIMCLEVRDHVAALVSAHVPLS